MKSTVLQEIQTLEKVLSDKLRQLRGDDWEESKEQTLITHQLEKLSASLHDTVGRVVDALHLKLTPHLGPLSHLRAEFRSLELKLEEKKEIWGHKLETTLEERGLAIQELGQIEKEIS